MYPLWSGQLRSRLLEIGQGPLHQAVPVPEVPQQRIPQRLLGQDARIAQYNQPIPGPREGHIHAAGIAEEADALQAQQLVEVAAGRKKFMHAMIGVSLLENKLCCQDHVTGPYDAAPVLKLHEEARVVQLIPFDDTLHTAGHHLEAIPADWAAGLQV